MYGLSWIGSKKIYIKRIVKGKRIEKIVIWIGVKIEGKFIVIIYSNNSMMMIFISQINLNINLDY